MLTPARRETFVNFPRAIPALSSVAGLAPSAVCLAFSRTVMLWELLFVVTERIMARWYVCDSSRGGPSERTLFVMSNGSSDRPGAFVFAGGLERCQNLLHGNRRKRGMAGRYLPRSSGDVHKFTHFYFSWRNTRYRTWGRVRDRTERQACRRLSGWTRLLLCCVERWGVWCVWFLLLGFDGS